MPSLLVKVKKKMSIYAQRKTRNILDGEYGSVFKGRSMDFDDLRVYSFGDDIKDVDWKATARSGQILIRRYVAVRKHNIMIVADTGRSMVALGNADDSKRDISLLSAGVIAYIAQKHGDLIGLVAGNSKGIKQFPLKESTAHLEHLLKTYDESLVISSPAGDMESVLKYISRNFKERMVLVVITDAKGIDSVTDEAIKHLSTRHEQLYIIVKDIAVTSQTLSEKAVYDLDNPDTFLPRFIRSDKKLREEEAEFDVKLYDGLEKRLRRRGISSITIDSEAKVIDQIIRLLERQKHARR